MLSSHRLFFTFTLNSSSSSISLRSRSFRSLSPLNFYRSISFNSSLYHSTISHDQRWTEKPQTIEGVSTSAAEAVGNAHGAVNVTGKSRQSHGQKSVWKPRSYRTVSGATIVEVEKAPMDRAIVTKQGNGTETASSDKSNPLLTKLLSGNLLQNFTVDSTTYSNAQIRATFYPKFENEKSDLEIRSRMVELVSNGKAKVEVSLKHSGSLFMYAGHEGGAYAKNSFGNIYTAVGVFVLGRMFRVAWGSRASKKQSEFNDYLERNRLCISMELVTAVLGDHGQRPREDYVVVTAVTDLGNGKPKFYSTPDIIGFCREWRLPTNHVWLFSTRKSVMSFFAAYDALCEEGTATPVCKALDEVADISVPGSADHTKVQGEILEGLVARIVTRESSNHMEQVLRDSPPPQLEGGKLDLGPSLRDIMAAHRKDEKEQIKALLESVGTSFCPSTVDWSERADAKSKDTDQAVLSKFLQANPSDFTTTKFQEMIRLMKKKNLPANFKSRYNFHKIESVTSDDLHFKMVVHVHRDATFKRYQKEMKNNPGLWPLYRGFFVDINLFKAINERAAEIAKSSGDIIKNANASNGIPGKDDLPENDANLMIKMKFLTYKLRTFLIRNGLRLLFKDGPTAYKNYYMKQMKIWNTSAAKQRELIRMLDEWAVHIRRKYKTELSSSMYLTELEPFLEQYAKRSPQNQALIGSAGNFIRSEDFMAIIEGGRDEEGDLEKTEEELAPSSPSPSVAKDSVRKDEGLIVFFPGIPGCAKSALCKEIVATPGGLGDDRPIQSMMGDLIKAKYWQKVAAERRKKPYSIMLADKNAPNEEVWGQIEGMCQSTKASAVPVVVESEGTETNPYSLDTLAVFIVRVLHRVNHPGKLDKACPNVGYVLLMFYHLYEGKSHWEFESELIERFGSLVKMPLLKPDRNPLPGSIKSILEEGINLFSLHSSRHGRMESTKGTYASDWAKWEKQLRDTLLKDAQYLKSIQVPFEFAVKQVMEQLRAIAKGDYERPVTERRRLGTIVFAAVCLPVTEIQSLVDNLVQRNPKLGVFLEGKNLENKLQRAHLTLAHKKSHGVTAVASYGSLLHQVVPVSMSALFFSDKLAALEAHPGTVDGEKVMSKNPWPHVTLWTAEGVKAKDASTLPQLLSEGKATRILIDPPVTITGTLEFY